jgi:hypothetical protein
MRLAIFVWLGLPSSISFADPSAFARRLCHDQPQVYECLKMRVPRNARRQYLEWREMFPDSRLRQAVMRINRRNTILWNGHRIAVPRRFDPDPLAYSPFPREVLRGFKHVVVDLRVLAWAAYEPLGADRARLARWGIASGGSKRCRETGLMRCATHHGTHFIMRLDGYGKRSSLYPPECADKKSCGHPMPYYMPFHRDGTGIHSDKWLVGRNASHGCVRMLIEDARWLNRKFAFVGMPVLVERY